MNFLDVLFIFNWGELLMIFSLINRKPEAEQLCKEFFDWRLLEFPEFATFCGYHQYDDRLNDHSVASFNRKKVTWITGTQNLM